LGNNISRRELNLPTISPLMLRDPRAAARVCRTIAHSPDILDQGTQRIANATACSVGQAAAFLSGLEDLGWIRRDMGGRLTVCVSSDELERFCERLEGAADAQLASSPESVPEIVITRPPHPSRLVDALERVGAPAIFWTRDGVIHLAERAERKLTILTPFLDSGGVTLLEDLFARTRAIERRLILRPHRAGQRPWMALLAPLRAHGVSCREYWLSLEPSSDTQAVETFHAKMIVADDKISYVGSANFLVASLTRSLECGVLLEGHAARVTSILADAIWDISTAV
jgi:phosphatidylserine/phosphatidylglycerophosphate/cardiolipin synthase-like enzyme